MNLVPMVPVVPVSMAYLKLQEPRSRMDVLEKTLKAVVRSLGFFFYFRLQRTTTFNNVHMLSNAKWLSVAMNMCSIGGHHRNF